MKRNTNIVLTAIALGVITFLISGFYHVFVVGGVFLTYGTIGDCLSISALYLLFVYAYSKQHKFVNYAFILVIVIFFSWVCYYFITNIPINSNTINNYSDSSVDALLVIKIFIMLSSLFIARKQVKTKK